MIYINSTAYNRWFLKKESVLLSGMGPVSCHCGRSQYHWCTSPRKSPSEIQGSLWLAVPMILSICLNPTWNMTLAQTQSQLYIFLKDRKLKPYSHGVHARKIEGGHCLCKMIFKAWRKKKAKPESINLDPERHCRSCRRNLWRAHKDLFTGRMMTAFPFIFRWKQF